MIFVGCIHTSIALAGNTVPLALFECAKINAILVIVISLKPCKFDTNWITGKVMRIEALITHLSRFSTGARSTNSEMRLIPY